MTCNPNTISGLSNCLRCLTDAQLMFVRTFLLCRWVQVAANAVGSLNVLSTPGGFIYQIVVDDLGNLGTISGSGFIQNLTLASMPGGIIYKIVVDDLGNLGTVSSAGVGKTLFVTSIPSSIKYQIIVDDLGNLGTL
jgi:hypothetical protein